MIFTIIVVSTKDCLKINFQTISSHLLNFLMGRVENNFRQHLLLLAGEIQQFNGASNTIVLNYATSLPRCTPISTPSFTISANDRPLRFPSGFSGIGSKSALILDTTRLPLPSPGRWCESIPMAYSKNHLMHRLLGLWLDKAAKAVQKAVVPLRLAIHCVLYGWIVVGLSLAKQWAEVVNKHGGKVEVIELPKVGIKGNTHFPMSDTNNAQVAEHLAEWLKEKGLDK